MLACVHNPNTLDAEEEGQLWVQDQPELKKSFCLKEEEEVEEEEEKEEEEEEEGKKEEKKEGRKKGRKEKRGCSNQ